MAFAEPITIKDALARVAKRDFVLPAIQREFVWKQEQIARLFDSLMQGYPIGSFLFWQIDPEHTQDYQFYGFVRDYHEKDGRHCPPADVVPHAPVTAILDGQQRLTALYIGLYGSHALKEPRKHWNNPDAFVTKRLYLNLLQGADEDNELGMHFDFRFLSDAQAKRRSADQHWFPVSHVRQFTEVADVQEYVFDEDLNQTREPMRMLSKLFQVIQIEKPISYFQERDQDLDKVLNIFIRTNEGGTPLSYSDLLLSIAVAQWRSLDARQEIHALVDELNQTRPGFNLSKDFVLKAGLMLADIASVGFKVSNFTQENMARLEQVWPEVKRALQTTVQLVSSFGFSGQTLSADSALLPLAYYAYHQGLDTVYIFAQREAQDRETIRRWLIRTLLKSGVWGSGLDTLLTLMRQTIQEHGASRFPIEEIEAAMARRGRTLSFENEEIDDLLTSRYGDRRTFALLSLLYPFIDLRNEFHVDHVFPKKTFDRRQLLKAGIAEEDVEELKGLADHLPNLQLLEG